MAINNNELEDIIKQSFPSATIKITDLIGDSDHYSLEIKDESFKGISLIAQHKMVKQVLAEVLKTRLHALTIKTIIPN